VTTSVASGVTTIRLSGTFTADQAKSLINSLQYRNDAGDTPSSGTKNFTLISLKDSGGTANSGVDTTILNINSSVNVTAVNDAPIIQSTSNFTSINEDPTVNSGNTVKSLFMMSDSDIASGLTDDQIGMAIYKLDQSAGKWFYSKNNGVSWTEISGVSESQALLLAATDKIKYVPDSNQNGSYGIDFFAWDKTLGVAGEKYNVTMRGGSTAFSGASGHADIMVNAINDAPTITAGDNTVFPDINEDINSQDNNGLLTSQLLLGYSDVDTPVWDTSFRYLAITKLGNEVPGVWQYRYISDNKWTDIPSIRDGQAYILQANDNVSLRFQPSSNAYGQNSISYRAYNGDLGNMSGQMVDMPKSFGADSWFSAEVANALINVLPVNDAPIVTGLGLTMDYFPSTQSPIQVFKNLIVDTVESGQGIIELCFRVDGLKNGSSEKILLGGQEIELVSASKIISGCKVDVTKTGETAQITVKFDQAISNESANGFVQSIGYLNDPFLLTAGARTITFVSLRDDGGGADQAVVNIQGVANTYRTSSVQAAVASVSDQMGLLSSYGTVLPIESPNVTFWYYLSSDAAITLRGSQYLEPYEGSRKLSTGEEIYLKYTVSYPYNLTSKYAVVKTSNGEIKYLSIADITEYKSPKMTYNGAQNNWLNKPFDYTFDYTITGQLSTQQAIKFSAFGGDNSKNYGQLKLTTGDILEVSNVAFNIDGLYRTGTSSITGTFTGAGSVATSASGAASYESFATPQGMVSQNVSVEFTKQGWQIDPDLSQLNSLGLQNGETRSFVIDAYQSDQPAASLGSAYSWGSIFNYDYENFLKTGVLTKSDRVETPRQIREKIPIQMQITKNNDIITTKGYFVENSQSGKFYIDIETGKVSFQLNQGVSSTTTVTESVNLSKYFMQDAWGKVEVVNGQVIKCGIDNTTLLQNVYHWNSGESVTAGSYGQYLVGTFGQQPYLGTQFIFGTGVVNTWASSGWFPSSFDQSNVSLGGSYGFVCNLNDPVIKALATGEEMTFSYLVTPASFKNSGLFVPERPYWIVQVHLEGTDQGPKMKLIDTSPSYLNETDALNWFNHAVNDNPFAYLGVDQRFFETNAVYGQYGCLNFKSDGTWDYEVLSTLAADSSFVVGAQRSELIKVKNSMGTYDDITATITKTASGFTVRSGIEKVGKYGSFYLKSDATWEYYLNQNIPAIKNIYTGELYLDKASFVDNQGKLQQVFVKIQGESTGKALLSNVLTNVTTGTIINKSEILSYFTAGTTKGQYGSLTIDIFGKYFYQLNDAPGSLTRTLAAGQEAFDVFTISRTDGGKQSVRIAILGSDDMPVVTGEFTKTIQNNVFDAITGKFSVSDVDAGANPEFVTKENIQSKYGIFSIDSAGQWTYQVSPQVLVALGTGQSLVDTIDLAVVSSQGNEALQAGQNQLKITLTGKNDGIYLNALGSYVQEVSTNIYKLNLGASINLGTGANDTIESSIDNQVYGLGGNDYISRAISNTKPIQFSLPISTGVWDTASTNFMVTIYCNNGLPLTLSNNNFYQNNGLKIWRITDSNNNSTLNDELAKVVFSLDPSALSLGSSVRQIVVITTATAPNGEAYSSEIRFNLDSFASYRPIMVGGGGLDTLIGAANDELIIGSSYAEQKATIDSLSFLTDTQKQSLSLQSGKDNTADGFNILMGGAGSDVLIGGNQGNKLYGDYSITNSPSAFLADLVSQEVEIIKNQDFNYWKNPYSNYQASSLSSNVSTAFDALVNTYNNLMYPLDGWHIGNYRMPGEIFSDLLSNPSNISALSTELANSVPVIGLQTYNVFLKQELGGFSNQNALGVNAGDQLIWKNFNHNAQTITQDKVLIAFDVIQHGNWSGGDQFKIFLTDSSQQQQIGINFGSAQSGFYDLINGGWLAYDSHDASATFFDYSSMSETVNYAFLLSSIGRLSSQGSVVNSDSLTELFLNYNQAKINKNQFADLRASFEDAYNFFKSIGNNYFDGMNSYLDATFNGATYGASTSSAVFSSASVDYLKTYLSNIINARMNADWMKKTIHHVVLEYDPKSNASVNDFMLKLGFGSNLGAGTNASWSIDNVRVLTDNDPLPLKAAATPFAATDSQLQGGDTLYGGNSVDTLYGGGGSDTLMGGSGADTLVGDYRPSGEDSMVIASDDFEVPALRAWYQDFTNFLKSIPGALNNVEIKTGQVVNVSLEQTDLWSLMDNPISTFMNKINSLVDAQENARKFGELITDLLYRSPLNDWKFNSNDGKISFNDYARLYFGLASSGHLGTFKAQDAYGLAQNQAVVSRCYDLTDAIRFQGANLVLKFDIKEYGSWVAGQTFSIFVGNEASPQQVTVPFANTLGLTSTTQYTWGSVTMTTDVESATTVHHFVLQLTDQSLWSAGSSGTGSFYLGFGSNLMGSTITQSWSVDDIQFSMVDPLNIHNDILQGEAGDDVLYGGLGDDSLVGGLGHDQMKGGAGNDTLLADKADITGSDVRLQGGEGVDVLRFIDANNTSINLTQLYTDSLEGLEIIDITNETRAMNLTVDFNHVLSMSPLLADGKHRLFIEGDMNDALHLKNNIGAVWSVSAQSVETNNPVGERHSYKIFHAERGGDSVDVYVNNNVYVDIS
jgi:VCBS repeat-containing protein